MSESNNNIPMRITQLEEATAYEDGMYYAVAKAGSGTKKINIGVDTPELANTKNIVNYITNPNEYDPTGATEGKRLSPEGAVMDAAGFFVSDYMEVIPNINYIKNSPEEDAYHRIVYYNSNKVAINSGISNNNITTAPNNAKYALVCGRLTEKNSLTFKALTAKDDIARANNADLISNLNSFKTQTDKHFHELSGNRVINQYIDNSSIVENSVWHGLNTETGAVGTQPLNGFARFAPVHISAGTYTISKVHFDVSYIVYDDLNGGTFRTQFPEQGSAGYITFTFTIEQGATIYASIGTAAGFTNCMLVDGGALPAEFEDKGQIITGLADNLSIGDHTLQEVNQFINEFEGQSINQFMYIRNGRVVSNGNTAQYAEVDVKGKIKKIMARIIFENGAGGDVATLIAVQQLRENLNGPVADIGNGSVHINFTKSAVSIQYFESGTLHNVTGFYYTNECVADGQTEYEIGFEFLGNNTIRVYRPDGETRDVTDEHFDSNNGNYFIFETSSVTGNDTKINYTGVFCSTEDAIPYLRDNFKRQDGALGVANTGHTYRVFKVGRTSIYDF